jgi:hypothetical protein
MGYSVLQSFTLTGLPIIPRITRLRDPLRRAIKGKRVCRFMSLDECKFLMVLILLFFIYIFLFRRNLRGVICIFFLSCVTGLAAQFPLGRALNLYTPNITLYVSYVSIAVVAAWGAGLTSIWAVHTWLAKILGQPPGFATYVMCGMPILIFLEFLGSNYLKMKLYNYRQYAALMPFMNSMHAPVWIFGYYIAIAIGFFFVLRALGLYDRNWDGPFFQNPQTLAAADDEGTD